MSPEREWKFRIADIVEAIHKVQRYTAGLTFEQFAGDERTVDAVVRNFLVIGEAARHVPDDVRIQASEIPWKLMEGMRHVLVHHYEAVSLETVWKTVREDLPQIIEPLRRLVRQA